ncbi:MAG TPA: hypothetical protein PKY29_03935 [Ferruginibacter sp.]|nr:hypothetical protein [Ferruginibacter sp.]HRO17005.1 hypothetical protein [Ferruginibacter sp.]HRQ20436.1 hypothetical protein [Ferruginibacter sp.]
MGISQLKVYSLFIACWILTVLTSCQSGDAKQNRTYNVGKAKSPSEDTAEFLQFDRVRIQDKKGFAQPVEAFSLLVPSGWQTTGEVIWVAPGQTCAGNNIHVRAADAGNQYVFELYPSVTWSHTSNAQLQQFQEMQPVSAHCYYGQPLNAEEYLRQVFAPNELGNPKVLSVQSINEAGNLVQESNQKVRAELMSYGASDVQFQPSGVYARVLWSNGKEGLVMLLVNVAQTTLPNMYTGGYDVSYTSQALQRVVLTFPAGEEKRAEKMLTVMMSSYRTNPAWKEPVDQFWRGVRQNNQQIHIGKLRAMDEQTRDIGNRAIAQGNQRLQEMDNQMRNWEARQQQNDRMHTQFVKTIREVEHYRDETGKIELGAGYQHAWSRNNGNSYILTDDPNFNPASVLQDQQWKEMKKVQD